MQQKEEAKCRVLTLVLTKSVDAEAGACFFSDSETLYTNCSFI